MLEKIKNMTSDKNILGQVNEQLKERNKWLKNLKEDSGEKKAIIMLIRQKGGRIVQH